MLLCVVKCSYTHYHSNDRLVEVYVGFHLFHFCEKGNVHVKM